MTLEEVTTLKEAIKRLKEVIKEVRSTIQPFLYDNEAKDYILKALEREPKWIPVSEKLPDHPENNDYYLVTIQCEHYDGWDDYVTGFAEWTEHGWDELSCYIGQIKVIAWMPLPEPYKAESEDQNDKSM